MKPARKPASSRPKPCVSLKKSHESCPFAAPCDPRRKKNDRGQTSDFPSETSRFTPLILAHRGSALPGSAIELSSTFVESGAYPPGRALPGSPRQCSLPHAATRSRRAPNRSSEGAHTWEHHPEPTIPPPCLNGQAEPRRQPVGMKILSYIEWNQKLWDHLCAEIGLGARGVCGCRLR